MVADYEAAWVELSAYVASKTQHGREGLLVEMAAILDRHRVPAGEKARLLRLYGVEVERQRAIEAELDRDEGPDFDGGQGSPADGSLPGHHDLGGHDGRRTGSGHHGDAGGEHARSAAT